MTYADNARILAVDELMEILNMEYENPTIQRLMYIETRGKGDIPGKVFPCYLEAWKSKDGGMAKADPAVQFGLCIVQSSGGEFGMVRVRVGSEELGKDKRIWDLPPTEALRKQHPFMDSGVIQ